MQGFYADIQRIVGELMYADNFYIVLYDEERKRLNWAYGVDEAGDTFPDPNIWEPMGTGQARGLTAYVLRSGEPLFVTLEDIQQMVRKGRSSSSASRPSTGWGAAAIRRQDGQRHGGAELQRGGPPHRRRRSS
jgi:hypothetical protein